VKKRILVVARHNKVEALRVAAGLTLVNDIVKVDAVGGLDDSPEIRSQRDVLEFAEVPCDMLDESRQGFSRLAEDILQSDVVYVI
jgi:hypothetical protein